MNDEKAGSYLLIVTHGTYAHHDDGYSALLMGNALLSFQEKATLLLLGDGVYLAVKGQDPASLGLAGYLKYIKDFMELGGKVLALKDSLELRHLEMDKLVEGVDIIDTVGLCQEIKKHRATVTF